MFRNIIISTIVVSFIVILSSVLSFFIYVDDSLSARVNNISSPGPYEEEVVRVITEKSEDDDQENLNLREIDFEFSGQLRPRVFPSLSLIEYQKLKIEDDLDSENRGEVEAKVTDVKPLVQENVFQQLNIHRQMNGKRELKRDFHLNSLARDMYFHLSNGLLIEQFNLESNLRKNNYNFAILTGLALKGGFVEEWDIISTLSSHLEHNNRFLSDNYREIGLSLVRVDDVYFLTIILARPLSDCVLPDESLRISIENKIQEFRSLQTSSRENVISEELLRQLENISRFIEASLAEYNNQVGTFNGCLGW